MIHVTWNNFKIILMCLMKNCLNSIQKLYSFKGSKISYQFFMGIYYFNFFYYNLSYILQQQFYHIYFTILQFAVICTISLLW